MKNKYCPLVKANCMGHTCAFYAQDTKYDNKTKQHVKLNTGYCLVRDFFKRNYAC